MCGVGQTFALSCEFCHLDFCLTSLVFKAVFFTCKLMYVIHELDVYLCVGELASLGYDLFDRVVSIE